MNLRNTTILTFFATVTKMVAALVINKVVAIYAGPSGLALIGQFQNFTKLVMTIAQGAINTGVTKYTAEYGHRNDKISALFSTAGKISIVSSLIVGASVFLLSEFLSLYFLKSEHLQYVFQIFGISLILFVLNNLLLSIINGFKETRTWVSINIIQSLLHLFYTSLLVYLFGVDGALISLVTSQAIVFFVTLWKLRNHTVLTLNKFKGKFDPLEAKKLLSFVAMALVTALTAPVTHMLIRNYIVETLSWEKAGHWQAMWYVSTMFLMVINTTLSIYYLPKLSELVEKEDLRKELWQGYKFIMPLVFFMASFVFAMRDFIIWILFTPDFDPMRELFLWQLIGSVLKVAAQLLAYLMLAKVMMKSFIITEIFFSVNFFLLSIIFIDNHGLVGMSYSFALNYLIYFFSMIFITKKYWF